MPKKPDVSPTLNIDIDTDAKYVLKLSDLEEQASQFENSKEGDMSLVWKFRMWNQDTGEEVLDLNTNLGYELWQFTSDATYRNEKTGKVAKAREWMEALLGKALSDDEVSAIIDEGFAEALMGRRAVADVEWYTTKGGNERLKIIRLKPFKAKAKAAPQTDEEADTFADGVSAAMRSPMPQAKAIPPKERLERIVDGDVAVDTRRAANRAALGLDDEDEAPPPARREKVAA